jgi:hypothetical protein
MEMPTRMQRHGINGHDGRMASSLEMSDRDFDRQATLGGLLSALRGTTNQ